MAITEPMDWLKVMNEVERRGIESMNHNKLHSIIADIESARKEKLEIIESKRSEHLKRRRQRQIQESLKLQRIENEREALMEYQMKEKAIRLRQWHEKLKEKDRTKAAEKRNLIALLEQEKLRSDLKRKQALVRLKRPECVKGGAIITIEPPPDTVTPPLTSRTTMSFFARLATPTLERKKGLPDSYLHAMKDSMYARSTKLASNIYCRKPHLRK